MNILDSRDIILSNHNNVLKILIIPQIKSCQSFRISNEENRLVRYFLRKGQVSHNNRLKVGSMKVHVLKVSGLKFNGRLVEDFKSQMVPRSPGLDANENF